MLLYHWRAVERLARIFRVKGPTPTRVPEQAKLLPPSRTGPSSTSLQRRPHRGPGDPFCHTASSETCEIPQIMTLPQNKANSNMMTRGQGYICGSNVFAVLGLIEESWGTLAPGVALPWGLQLVKQV